MFCHTFTMANCLPYFIQRCILGSISKRLTMKRVDHLLFKSKRQYSSALFVSARKAKEVFSFITPYLDFDERLSNLEKLQRDLTSRGLNVDANEVKKMWDLYKSVNSDKCKLEERLSDLAMQLKQLLAKENLTEAEQLESTKIRIQYKAAKQDLKLVKETLWDLSETIVVKMLKLPNEVDERTPLRSSVLLKRRNTLPEFSDTGGEKNHIEIGRELGLLEYKNPMQYYLCNDAALFELGVLNYAGKVLRSADMIRVAGSDFSRSLVVEGSGLNHECPTDAFIIDNHNEVVKNSPNRMHLVGGASLISFLAMHSKQLINPNNFPIKYFATGRQYTPFPPSATPIGLFTVCQTSAAHAFVIVKDSKGPEYHEEFEKLLNTVSELYDNICDHYQVVVRPASELRPWEAIRVSFELWSPFSKQYIEVGHISACGSYFSKRLLIAYQTPTGRDFPSVISGTVLSVPRLLGCLLEQNGDKFVIPPKVLEHTPRDQIGI